MIRRCEFTAAILTCTAAILTSAAAAVPVTSGGLSNVVAGFSRLQPLGGGTGSSQRPLCFYSAHQCVTSGSGNPRCSPLPTSQIDCRADTSFNSDGYSNTFCKIFWRNGQVLKGCHTQLTNECSNSACVARVGDNASSGFCCCNTSLCNSAYELPPPPPQSPPASEPTGPTPPPPHSGHPQSQSATGSGGRNGGRLLSPAVLIAVAVALVVLLLVVAWLYMRRRRTATLLANAAAAAAAAGAERKIDRHNCRAIPKDCSVNRRCAVVATPADEDSPTSARSDDSAELRRRVTPLLRLTGGRFCTVWKAAVLSPAKDGGGDRSGGRYVAAIKVVGRQHRRQWEAERDIYELLASAQQQQPANVASFIGAADCSDESGPASGLWIVTAYCERGSLYEYLRARTLSPTEACRIAHGTAAGLAFLHEHSSRLPAASAQQQLVEISRAACGDGCRSSDASTEAADLARRQRICGKPSIAHRDLKSDNVLLTGDLTPRIVDFGLAAQFDQEDAPRGVGGGFRFGPDLQLVGTLRYLAPEMLEGAVEYTRDALLQCDVYSLGLVLWELLSRTSFTAFDDASEAGTAVSAAAAAAAPPPRAPYERPFERELGPQPTLAALQEAVAAHRVRPSAEPHWLRWRIGAQLFETAVDCWDADAGARVTASCAEQRLRALLDTLPPPSS